jgi:hypothetical protein
VEPLDDERRLISAEKVPLFMLPTPVPDRLALRRRELAWEGGLDDRSRRMQRAG